MSNPQRANVAPVSWLTFTITSTFIPDSGVCGKKLKPDRNESIPDSIQVMIEKEIGKKYAPNTIRGL